jgi:saccharopine dehydrogenase-like NADP-dependent oxidoreductase
MYTILIAGAGKSSTFLIQYLIERATERNWKLIVADGDPLAIAEKTQNSPFAEAAPIDITQASQREPLVQRADIVVSLMPPTLHIHLAKDCLKYKKHLITSSYVSDELLAMDKAVKEANLMFMCEMGLDPGIDHMSANKMIHEIHAQGGVIGSFKSYCGGLIAPDSDDNPWHYKFTWNPKNIITAGLGGAYYLLDGKEVYVPYEQIFSNNAVVHAKGVGDLAWYANRDSLKYLELYELEGVTTFLRATLRYPEFCIGWEAIQKCGLTATDDSLDTAGMTYTDWIRHKIGASTGEVRLQTASFLKLASDHQVMRLLDWLGLFSDAQLPACKHSSADLLLQLLLNKWSMAPKDIDMVVMIHELEYAIGDKPHSITSTLVAKGEDRERSSMAKTVGMPMALLAEMVLDNKVQPQLGVCIPNMPEVYEPILTALQPFGIEFEDEVK